MSDDGRRVVKLAVPVRHGDEEILELRFRSGRLGDLKGITLRPDGMPVDDLLKVAGRLCGQPSTVIEQLDQVDAGEVMGLALDFYRRCLETGPTPSG